MPSLKDLKNRRQSVESTKKITTAMKMIAVAKLRKAQEHAERARPYSNALFDLTTSIIKRASGSDKLPELLVGNGKKDTHLLVVFTSDRGLCGGFNGYVIKKTIEKIKHYKNKGRAVKIFCIGRKGAILLQREYGDMIVEKTYSFDRPEFLDAQRASDKITQMFFDGQFDRCTMIYTKFISALNQEAVAQQIIPFKSVVEDSGVEEKDVTKVDSLYKFEPSITEVLEDLVPKNLTVQIFKAMLESAASEHGARMTAMESATKNAEEMIADLQLTYNRTRQAYITKELIEIISGAEALN